MCVVCVLWRLRQTRFFSLLPCKVVVVVVLLVVVLGLLGFWTTTTATATATAARACTSAIGLGLKVISVVVTAANASEAAILKLLKRCVCLFLCYISCKVKFKSRIAWFTCYC